MINFTVLQAVRVLGLSMLAFLVAFTITPLVMRFILKINAKKQIKSAADAPIFNALHKSKEGTPVMGGIIVWATVLGVAAVIFILAEIFGGFWGYLDFIDRAQTYLPLAAMLFAALIGFLDDIYGILKKGPRGGGLSMRFRLMIYTLFALLGAYWFYYRLEWDVLQIPFIGNVTIGWWYIPLFIFILVASAFSANETDGLDGLAGGVMLFTFLAFTVVSFALGRYDLAVLCGVIIGALLAFLWFNIYPARFFMGDTGSMSLGITIGVVSMLTNTTLLLPLFAPIFVLESASVIMQLASKKIRGKKIFLSTPIHHHFEALGWHETKVTMRFWIISVIGVGFGLTIFFLNRFF